VQQASAPFWRIAIDLHAVNHAVLVRQHLAPESKTGDLVRIAGFERMAAAIMPLLTRRELTSPALKAALHTDADLAPFLIHLLDRGVLIRGRPPGGWKDRQQTYALFADYFPGLDLAGTDEGEATRWLIRYYLAAFGPATETDIVWWLGLTRRSVREALSRLAGEVATADIVGLAGPHFLLATARRSIDESEPPPGPLVNLLPIQDPYLTGYKERERYLDPQQREFVFDRGGNPTSTILLGGRVVGVWDAEAGKLPQVKFLLFGDVPPAVRQAIESEAGRLGRFIFEKEVAVRECESMQPLTGRTMGTFLSSLRGC